MEPETGTDERGFPRWRLARGPVVLPDERPPGGQVVVLALQHVVAMFGSTALAPLLMGFDPNLAILFSGIATLLFFVVVGGRVPSYLGSSFAFIAVVIAATGYGGSGPNPNLAVALGGIIAAGAVYALIGIAVMRAGDAWIGRLMPPAVTGAIVGAIALNLAPIGVKGISGSGLDVGVGLFTILSVGLAPPTCPARRGACRSSSGRRPRPCSTACWRTASGSPSPSISGALPRPRGSAGRTSPCRSSSLPRSGSSPRSPWCWSPRISAT